ncbi:porin family protein [Chryseobacterium sp. MYb264]|uniref:porin family protein n=1 Tax=Chryseobacterium sp. MYb264 TaxID=2745153 RepID=UPI002E140E94|nr:porin family protein [Chryseobacterium sp. MYb264]
MKKLLLSAALLACTLSFAQTLGLKAGLNVSNISGGDTNSKAGFYGGAFLNVPVAKNFSVQPEILFNGVGAVSDIDSNMKINLSYISVPIMFQYNALPNLYLEAGPQFSFLAGSKLKYNNYSESANDLVKGFDFGIGLGAGYYITKNIGINARYVAGVTDITKKIEGEQIEGKNNVFQVGLSYKFK